MATPQLGAALNTTRLLATDLDGTFIGDHESMGRLWEELEKSGIVVSFATGRHLDSVLGFYEEVGTKRRARVCVCMVGTEIWWYRERQGHRLDVEWSSLIRKDWDPAGVAAALDAMPELSRQPAEWQSDLKVSYFLDRGAAAGAETVSERLRSRGLGATVVYSAERYIDVLPVGSGKGAAVAWVADRLGVAAENVVVAGDTGNDLDMMSPRLGFRSIAVGNATSELRAHVGPHIYHATAHNAAGIREGLVHHGWLDP